MNLGSILSHDEYDRVLMHQTFPISKRVLGFKNYRHGDKNRRCGAQGGVVNDPMDVRVSSHNLGLSCKNEPFGISLGELYYALSSVSQHEVWLASMFWKVCPSPGFQHCLLLSRLEGLE